MLKKICKVVYQAKEKILFASILGWFFVGDAFAALPAGFTPTGGGGSATDPAANLDAWVKEILGYIIAALGAIVFIAMVIECITSFSESKQSKNWKHFGVCVVIGLLMVILVLWALNFASQSLT